jgi:hypothetical protein
MKLFLVHAGFYDADLCDGIYESHANFLVAAEDFEDARIKAKLLPEFKDRRMHVDGMFCVEAVSGYTIELKENRALNGETKLTSRKHRDFATVPAGTPPPI